LPALEQGDVAALHHTRVASRRLRALVPMLQIDGDAAKKLGRRLRKVTPSRHGPRAGRAPPPDRRAPWIASRASGGAEPRGDRRGAPGDAAAGAAYFNGDGKCSTCHSPTASPLAGIGDRYSAVDLQQRFLFPSRGGRPA
jgi:hypothetical protein